MQISLYTKTLIFGYALSAVALLTHKVFFLRHGQSVQRASPFEPGAGQRKRLVVTLTFENRGMHIDFVLRLLLLMNVLNLQTAVVNQGDGSDATGSSFTLSTRSSTT